MQEILEIMSSLFIYYIDTTSKSAKWEKWNVIIGNLEQQFWFQIIFLKEKKRRIWHKLFWGRPTPTKIYQCLRKKPSPKKYQLIDLIFIFSSALKLSVYENTLLLQGLLSLFQLSGTPSRRTLWLKLNNVILLT